ncbi:6-hydroxynicotinate reductase [Sulfitobacter sp.]|jgi:6-hydroxynicotinate reductase|uniref:6-hydroxynicotinate reductase n=1 Tax=Sulfitobacter sp. TaxID=1903071 RepID=UPI000C44091B|nr:6-hydroxynicotinate reductase [Roseobacter sp.]MBV47359.1 6-hydroxynicotinate reductase [Roseobacter sp.]MBV47501.1 6-hydroxynicotinate reductase [Roseobacter sp.]|tara:strand:- start:11181 stop:12668 length:1488 start_codon:yes stop_codon:yes gene_type:complete
MPDDLRDPKPAKIRCDACPVMCFIADGKSGACDRYANHAGELVRLDPLTVIQSGAKAVAFLDQGDNAQDWDGDVIQGGRDFVTAVGAGTTYPDYKPAPFIVSQEVEGVDMITVVTEGIFSYCGVKVKIDTDRHIGDERAVVRVDGEAIGHVMTSEYGSKMLSLGGVEHLTGGSKKEGRATCDALLRLCNREPVEVTIDGGVTMVIEAGKAPIINGTPEKLMRVGCGSATIGMFAKQWHGHVDEVVVVDDHITGVLSEHEAGKGLNMTPSGIRINGRRSTPGRYFQVADPGTGWGGTDVEDPLTILRDADAKRAWPGLRLLMISTTGEQWAYFTLDDDLVPRPAEITPELLTVAERIAENCEPSLCSVLFMGGAGGSLRAGVTENPVRLTRSVKESLTHVSCGGAEAYVWPGGGITVMVDVMDMPTNSFGYVPTPALVAPIEFTLRREDYGALGGHVQHIQPLAKVVTPDVRRVTQTGLQTNPNDRENYGWGKSRE